MLDAYTAAAEERKALGIPPLPLSSEQVQALIRLLEEGHPEQEVLLELLKNRVEPGVSAAARIKAEWLGSIASGTMDTAAAPAPDEAIRMLAGMGGGYNVQVLLELLKEEKTAEAAAAALKKLTKVYEAFDQVLLLSESNSHAREIVESWARADWFFLAPKLPDQIELTVFKVDGEINTDDFSPGNQAQSRADIPLHATFFGHTRFPGGIKKIADYRAQGRTVAFAGDVVGTGSSRKSAINSMAWHLGTDIDQVPNKRAGGIILASTIAPIFSATARDAGLLPVICDVSRINNGDIVTLDLAAWTLAAADGSSIPLDPPPPTLLDEYRAGGRLSLIIGRNLTKTACEALERPLPPFREIKNPTPAKDQGYTLAQKMVGKACGVTGILPGTACEPVITTVGSQDTTGPMTMQEIAELACLHFKTDLFMQSFCHTAAYPKASDLERWQTMTETTIACGGVALKPGDGVIHSWLNTMLVPDTVGTGGDSHTRFPLGISFPAGSGLVAFAGALGFMPLEMPPSVRVRFTGQRRPGISVRDMVNAIAYAAIKQGLLTVAKKGKKNIFSGTILEIEGLDDLTIEEAFELSDASAERNAAACTLRLPLETVSRSVQANVELLRSLVDEGYEDLASLERRILTLEKWLDKPTLLQADDNAEYLATIEIDLATITEPLLACPNDPDDVKPLSEVEGTPVEEAFIGSCMVHLDHLRTAASICREADYANTRLWIAPPTRMIRDQLKQEGALAIFAAVGGRVEIPGCSLCMGNQARVRPKATVISTSTRNFDNRMGKDAQVFLASTEVTTLAALKGALPTVEEYFSAIVR
ncbi:MAG: bifunctional aconitate hydratase 2/2-methylisocitrate dehydratase [Desulfobulbus propionicus]|nr:MAG: bifunctional aconitate hydratase 2/2-methylisocitrate dehydratase [Desulfobulbus propionicus]